MSRDDHSAAFFGAARPPRRRPPRWAAAVGVLGLTLSAGCAALVEDDQVHRDPYAPVSPTHQEQSPSDGEWLDGAPLSEEEMDRLLLGSDEFPLSGGHHQETGGTDYFEEHIGVSGDSYVRSFGDQACAEQMDTVNERLVGEEPVDGLLREATRQADGADESLVVWALSYSEAPDRQALWDEVLQACEDATLASEEDTITFAGFEQDGFRGLTMEMTVDDGEEVHQVGGFSATMSYGDNLLMISGVDVDPEDFEATVAAQAEKLETFDAER